MANLKSIVQYLRSVDVPEDRVILITPPPLCEAAWEKECLAQGEHAAHHGAGCEARGEPGWDGGVQPGGLRSAGSVNPCPSVFSKQTLRKYRFPCVPGTVDAGKGASLWMGRAPGLAPENQADGRASTRDSQVRAVVSARR